MVNRLLSTIAVIAFLVACASSAALAADETPPTAAAGAIDFARDVQPILAAHCYKCHGAEKQESGLRLDRRGALLTEEMTYGRAIVPGQSDESVLLQAVLGTHADLERMPPKGDPLSVEQIATLKAWIDVGATWPEDAPAEAAAKGANHWAFKAPARPELPPVRNAQWCRNAIDYFVLARLEQEGLNPSPEADRVTLLRRLSLDLIGLPPSIEEVDALLADASDDAYAKQVERLLASPHYGERWGRHWLDAARYADSDGFEKDKSRNMWFYRDWVVGAFNRDLPYDQFIIEQIAGDLLPGATQDQRVATGFLRNSMCNEEGGVDPEQFRMEAMFDRMDCVGKSVLGLTIQCAQCHTHKFDPLTQEEYYRLFAFLNNDHEPQMVAYTPEETRQINDLRMQMQAIEEQARAEHPDWETRLAEWEAQSAAAQPAWTLLEPTEHIDVGGGAKLKQLNDHSLLCGGYAPTHCTFRVVAKTGAKNLTALRLEALTDPNLPCRGPGRSFKGTFYLTEIKVEAASAAEPDKKTELKLAAAAADYSQPEGALESQFDDRSGKKRIVGPIGFAIDGKNETAWGIDAGPGRRNQDRTAVFQFEKPWSVEGDTILTISIVQNHGGWNSDDHQNTLLGRFRLSVTDGATPAGAPPLPLDVRELFAVPRDQRSGAQQMALFGHWRKSTPELQAANEQIEALWRQWPAGSTSLGLAARDTPRETHMLGRGDFLKPGKTVTAGVPAFLHPLADGAPPTRLTFGKWLVDRQSPTTARVFVNRVWQAYFGEGLVSTPEDFGVQSNPPSHPELLDWLAVEFMEQGWSVKRLQRLITESATYRQSSHATPALYERDPQNRLLSRGPRVRVEGEIVRDVALAASGLLNRELGGPSVFPPMPESVLALSYGPMTWNAETGPNRYRRALYTFRRRSIPFPMLQNFDTPNGDSACVRRVRSNTPLQALTTLNEVVFMESAQALARQALAGGGASDDERLTYAFRRCVSRRPEPEELAELKDFLARQSQRLAAGWVSPWLLATGKETRPADLPAGITPTQLAAYTAVSRVLLNLDETITKE